MASGLFPFRRGGPGNASLAREDAGAALRPIDRSNGPRKRDDTAATGTVKWFNAQKGYGLIAPDEGGKDTFVHITAVRAAGLEGMKDNRRLASEIETGRDGRSSAGGLKLI